MLKPYLKLKLDVSREQVFAVGGFCALLIVCTVAIAGALQTRSEALQALADRRDQLASLEARSRSVANRSRQTKPSAAPVLAFLDAPTSGLATAQFQAYLSQLVTDQNAVLVSSGVPPADRDDKGDTIRVQFTLNATLPNLQSLLYRLESGAPYVFVDALLVQPSGSGERATADPVLKVNLSVHAFWRRKTV
jgi:general secretion pathway protein M